MIQKYSRAGVARWSVLRDAPPALLEARGAGVKYAELQNQDTRGGAHRGIALPSEKG
jgi:hypothetical protein